MKKYIKPIIIPLDASEGVYAASGSSCYTAQAYIHQTPETGRGDYRIQVNGQHNADHTKESQYLEIFFNQPVIYKDSNGTLLEGNGTTMLKIKFNYHQNPIDNIGLGNLTIESDAGLSIISVKITD